MPAQRPIAAMMVADPSPLTIANARLLSTWCDVVLCEATATLSGLARTPLRKEWHNVLGLDSDRLRIVTTDLLGETNSLRAHVQRNSVLPLLIFEDAERPVLTLDPDEILDANAVLRYIRDDLGDEPVRLGLTPLYGAIDRLAPDIHCCWYEGQEGLRDPEAPEQEYLVAATGLARAGSVVARNIDSIRFNSPLASATTPFGAHVTMAESAAAVAWKLRNNRHVWDPRLSNEQHLETMLSAGVHHAGWWIARHVTPGPELLRLAQDANLRIAGPPQPSEHLRALRAWAELRLDPSLPEGFVTAGDGYVAGRDPNSVDFLNGVDTWQLSRPIEHWGHELREHEPVHRPADPER